MQLVNDHVGKLTSAPFAIVPLIIARVYYLGIAMNIIGLQARVGIGQDLIAIKTKFITRAGANIGDKEREIAMAVWLHGEKIVTLGFRERHFQPLFSRRGNTK